MEPLLTEKQGRIMSQLTSNSPKQNFTYRFTGSNDKIIGLSIVKMVFPLHPQWLNFGAINVIFIDNICYAQATSLDMTNILPVIHVFSDDIRFIIDVPGVVYSSLYYCLLRLPLCRARCISFLLKLSRMTTLLG